jgi:D-glycero-D-manno-heptose 1,7-bisphosphate phosphatase
VTVKGEQARSRRRAVFLDRDGTINLERDYLHLPADFAFIPGAPEAIGLLKAAGFLVIVVTNQSGIARGYFDEAAVRRLHSHMDELLARHGTSVDAYYLCPHHPLHGSGDYRRDCGCRKPLPGMLVEAAGDFSIDLAASYVVGDKLADVAAGFAAGCRPLLVRTGYGEEESAALPPGVPCCDDLLDAARRIVAGEV